MASPKALRSDCGSSENRLCAPKFAVAQLLPDGQVDTAFGENGSTVTPVGFERKGEDFAIASSLAIQPDGRVVLSGDASVRGCFDCRTADADFALARYEESGELDRGFGRKGTVLTDAERGQGPLDSGRAGVVATREGIVQAGYAGTPNLRFTLVGIRQNGSPDRRFGKRGVVSLRPDGFAQASIAAPGDRIYVGGSVLLRDLPHRRDEAFALARYRLR